MKQQQRPRRKAPVEPGSKLPHWRSFPSFDFVGITPEGHAFGLTLHGYNPKWTRAHAFALTEDCPFSPALRHGFPGIQTIGHGARLHHSNTAQAIGA